jgi:hypothetical protein
MSWCPSSKAHGPPASAKSVLDALKNVLKVSVLQRPDGPGRLLGSPHRTLPCPALLHGMSNG